jgi:hypothetical protein
MLRPPFNKSDAIRAGVVLGGYVAACLAGAVSMAMILTVLRLGQQGAPPASIESLLGAVGVAGMFFLFACIVALPGFVVLRAGLYWLGGTDWASFAVAGGVNAWFALIVFNNPFQFSVSNFIQYPPNPIITLFGAVAGVTSWAVERRLQHWTRTWTPKAESP